MVKLISFMILAAIFVGQCPSVSAADINVAQKSQKEEAIKDAGNTVCPVTGDPVNKNISYVYKGTRYYFCCPMCIEPFKSDPEKYIAKMKAAEKK